MDYTINCTRVPSLQGTPDELGLAPTNLGLESDPVSIENDDEVALNQHYHLQYFQYADTWSCWSSRRTC